MFQDVTEDHKYGFIHFTDIQNGEMDGTNNTSKSINRRLKKFSSPGTKNLNTVFRALYNYKTDNNKRMLCATRNENELQMKFKNTIKLIKFYQNLTVFHLTSNFFILCNIGATWLSLNYISIRINFNVTDCIFPNAKFAVGTNTSGQAC